MLFTRYWPKHCLSEGGGNTSCEVLRPDFVSTKGQLISKENCQVEDSPKKRTNEFVFTSMRRVFVRFLGESLARKKTFQDYLTFKKLN